MGIFNVLIDNDAEKQYYFYCPGCKMHHSVRVRGPEPCWEVTGVEDNKPSVSPSILVRAPSLCCHSFVKKGCIQFLSDCTHALAGTTIELEEI